IRYSLDRPLVFQAQLRAILRAGAHGPVSIMLPMVTALEEADEALEHVATARQALDDEGVPRSMTCHVGALIETPAAALLAEDLVARFDFLSLGTNDLIQYALAVDRGNRRIAHLFQPFHPAVLKLIATVVAASGRAGLDLTVCGEMGSNTRAATLLLGLGLRSFSMVSARIPRVKQVLSRIGVEEARAAAGEALEARTAEAVRRVIDDRFSDRFRHTSPGGATGDGEG
nr:phosphoenolpyruvate--protein phosphotransferase [Gemmatimonadota bacterium]